MRFIDRIQVPKPKFIESPEFEEMRRTLANIHDAAGGGKRMKQRVESFDEMFSPFRNEAIKALHQVFHDKCAYTESPGISEMPLTFHLHRPGGDAMGFDGSVDPEHYWWLQTEWHNWMLVSPQIDSIKGTNFPVSGSRMEMGADSFDNGLLINPCEEEPSWWLEFDEKGGVSPRHIESEVLNKHFKDFDRGEINIRQLDLNNEQLVDGRRRAIKKSRLQYSLLIAAMDNERKLDKVLDPSVPYLGAIRHHGARVLCDNIEKLRKFSKKQPDFPIAIIDRLAPEIAAYLCAHLERTQQIRKNLGQKTFEPLFRPVIELATEKCPDLKGWFVVIQGIPTVYEGAQKVQIISGDIGAVDIEPQTKVATTHENTIGRSALLKEIRIRNFKAIEDLTIEIPEGVVEISTGPLYDRRIRTSAVNWKMLLGENASGKSSILQAIALALYGSGIENEPPVEVKDVRRRGIGNRISYIQLFFRGFDRPIKLKLNKSGFKYEWMPDYHTFVRAYGATRLFQSDGDKWDENRPSERIRVGNLFDPKYPVIDVDTWLMNLNDGDFNVAARAIRELIAGVGDTPAGVENDIELHRNKNKNRVMLGDDTLNELSDGYRALLAMICDIMAGLGAGLSDMENALGIVLIDEIGAHLHPRLRMQVVSRMRYIFPRIQFIASTHEPLCLRGLFENEVDRIRRINGIVSQETIERSPSSYRIDQLLTSEFFGLETTIDPEIDDQFQHYYHLLSKKELSDEEIQKRERLRTRLIAEGVLGYTRRDQLVYEAIDSYLANKKMNSTRPGSSEAVKLKQETIDRVKRYWGMAELKHIGGET